MPNWEVYKEAYDRGILPEGKKALYEEAVSRGLMGETPKTAQLEQKSLLKSVVGWDMPMLKTAAPRGMTESESEQLEGLGPLKPFMRVKQQGEEGIDLNPEITSGMALGSVPLKNVGLLGKLIPRGLKGKVGGFEKAVGGTKEPLEAGEIAQKMGWGRYGEFQRGAEAIKNEIPIALDAKISTENLARVGHEHIDELGKLDNETINRIKKLIRQPESEGGIASRGTQTTSRVIEETPIGITSQGTQGKVVVKPQTAQDLLLNRRGLNTEIIPGTPPIFKKGTPRLVSEFENVKEFPRAEVTQGKPPIFRQGTPELTPKIQNIPVEIEPTYTWQQLRSDQSKLGKMAESTKDFNLKRILHNLRDAIDEDIVALGQKTDNPNIIKKLDEFREYYKTGSENVPGIKVWRNNQIAKALRTDSPEDIVGTFMKPKSNISDIQRLKDVAGPEGYQPIKQAWAKDMLGGEGKFNREIFIRRYDAYQRGGNLDTMLNGKERMAFEKLYDASKRSLTVSKVVKWAEYGGVAGTAYYAARKIFGIPIPYMHE